MSEFKVALFAKNKEPFQYIHLMIHSLNCEVEFFSDGEEFLNHLKWGMFEIGIIDFDLSPHTAKQILLTLAREVVGVPLLGICKAESTSLLQFGIPLIERRSVSERFVSIFEKVLKRARGFRDLQENLNKLIGRSQHIRDLKEQIRRIAEEEGPVLISGESGTGKELVAKSIASFRQPFVAVNCSAIPENLFESEFFGHQRGAFTGAIAERKGLFQEAKGGTLFLDEIGELPLSVQAKLLRVLQEGEVKPVGSDQVVKLNVRVVAATHRDLKKEVEEGTFRKDLYYRLNVVPLFVEPLRKRTEDIDELVSFFLKKYSINPHLDLKVTPGSLWALKAYGFPGNIRELENKIQTALALQQPHRTLREEVEVDVELNDWSGEWGRWDLKEFKLWKTHREREFILYKLHQFRGNVIETAEALGMARTALHNKIRALNIPLKEVQSQFKRKP